MGATMGVSNIRGGGVGGVDIKGRELLPEGAGGMVGSRKLWQVALSMLHWDVGPRSAAKSQMFHLPTRPQEADATENLLRRKPQHQ